MSETLLLPHQRYFSQMWSHIVCCLSWAAPPMKVSGAALSPRLSAMPLQFYCSPFQSSCLAQRYMIKAALFSSVKRLVKAFFSKAQKLIWKCHVASARPFSLSAFKSCREQAFFSLKISMYLNHQAAVLL